MLSASAVSINKVRVSGRHGDPLALRLRLERVLSSLDLAPHGLPATAIIWIKRLRDPRPGLLDLWSNSLGSHFAWEQALREYLANLIARAPRLEVGTDAPLDAECVIVLDEADLLASLAADWCRGEIESRWWWRTLFKSSIVERREVVTRWRDAPEHVPAALERLGPRKIEFVKKLSDVEADELLKVVVQRFAVNEIAPLVRDSIVMNEDVLVEEEVITPRQEKVVTRREIIAAAPWRKFVSEIRHRQLTIAQERFLGVSLMLLRAPSVVRTRKFATEIAIWQREAPKLVEPPVQVKHERLQVQTPTTSRISEQFRSVLNPITPRPTEPQKRSVKSVFKESAATRTIAEPVVRGSEPDVFFENKQMPDVEFVVDEENFESSVSEEVVRNADQFEYVAAVETNFAGVFYLVNLGIYLGLYGDFTMPAQPGIELNIWDFVALVSRDLIGDEIENDPVWLLLADLAGREDELQNMETWLTELMPSIRQRLRAALGLDETIEPGPMLVAHSGRVRVTPTHIDVFMLLADLPIAIRFAGLDRDPGWVPAAGRFIAFHFD